MNPLRLSCLLLAPLLAVAQALADPLPPVDAGTVLLVIAPHPDDETLCCAGAIQHVLAGGGQVSIVWLTSGDGSPLAALFAHDNPLSSAAMRRLGALRMAEARAAARTLGVGPERQFFLGYPDGGLSRLLSTPQRVQRSRWTGADAVPYATALFPGHPYQGEALRGDFAALIERVRPTLVLAPSVLDTHPDHEAAARLAQEASAAHAATVLLWVVHGGEGWPAPRTLLPALPLPPPPVGAQLPWQALGLSAAEEDRKLAALERHASQMRVMAPFLVAFVRSTELYAAASGTASAPCVRCASASAGVLQPERTPQAKNMSPQPATTSRSQPQGR